jgi:hypothetical protein
MGGDMGLDRALLEDEPGPALAAAVLTADASALDRGEALVLLEAAARLTRALAAAEAALMVAAAGEEAVSDPPGQHDGDGAPLDEAGEEVAMTLGGNRHFVLNRLESARFLLRNLPRTLAAMRAGVFGWYEAERVKSAAEQLSDPDLISRLEARIVPRGTFDLARRLRRAVARLDPEGVRKKAEQKRRERQVRWWQDRDGGGGVLQASGPSHLMAILAAAIDVEAKPKQPGDCRTIDMRRFDVLIDWARHRLGMPDPQAEPDAPAPRPRTGRCESCGRTGPSRVPINVTVSLNTLLGLSEAPGELAGWGVLDADACRELAADGRFIRWLTQPQTGELLDLGADTYVPGDRLAGFVRGRDRVCCAPGCNRAAEHCDLDHREAFDHAVAEQVKQAVAAGDRGAAPAQPGPTVRANVGPLCRRHHRVKHAAGWSIHLDEQGNTVWTSPRGRTYTNFREHHGDDDLPGTSRSSNEAA